MTIGADSDQRRDALVAGLREIVGADHLLVDADLRAAYEIDWTRRYSGEALAVARPADAEQTARLLARCTEAQVPVVPQGGNTGMVGGSVPRDRPMVIVSTQRLTHRGEVDTTARQVSFGAGVTIAQWRASARGAGLDAPVDFGARDTATVGGAAATNAGGSRVLRFGTMRSQVMGLRAALSDGTVVGSLSGLPKETVGLHWPGLLCGSEGTLGVVTDVRLRLVPWYRHRAAVMTSLPLDDAPALLEAARRSLPHLDGAELILAEAMDAATRHIGRPAPVDGGEAFVILECAADEDPTDALTDFLAGVGVDTPLGDGHRVGGNGLRLGSTAIATDDAGIARLIEPRDRMAESMSRLGKPLKLDVAVPPLRLPDLVRLVRRVAAANGCHFVGFGHLAEGNVHVNLLGESNGDGTYSSIPAPVAERLAEEILGGTAMLGGTISAEHGVGTAKARWLPLVRSVDELRAIAAVKRALDPAGILNPGVLDGVGADGRSPGTSHTPSPS